MFDTLTEFPEHAILLKELSEQGQARDRWYKLLASALPGPAAHTQTDPSTKELTNRTIQ
jgi:hypothetical protein